MATLEQLVIEFSADFSQFDAELNRASQKARAKAKDLEQSVISPRVNLAPLHELNKLLDIKQRHIKETARIFQQNPIKTSVDTSEIRKAKAEVEDFKRSFKTFAGVKAQGNATLKVEHEYKVSIRESNQDIARSVTGLGKGLKEVVSAVQSTKPGLIGRAVGAVVSTPATIFKGALMGFGQDVVKDFSSGFKGGLNDFLSQYIGSIKLFGKQSAGDFVGGITNTFKSIGDIYGSAVKAEAQARADEIYQELKTRQSLIQQKQAIEKEKAKLQSQVSQSGIADPWSNQDTTQIKKRIKELNLALSNIDAVANRKGVSTDSLNDKEKSFLDDASVRERFTQNRAKQNDMRVAAGSVITEYSTSPEVMRERMKQSARKDKESRQDKASLAGDLVSFAKEAGLRSRTAREQATKKESELDAQFKKLAPNAKKARSELLVLQGQLKQSADKIKELQASGADITSEIEKEWEIKKQINPRESFLADFDNYFKQEFSGLAELKADATRLEQEYAQAQSYSSKMLRQRHNLKKILKAVTGKDVSDAQLPSVRVDELTLKRIGAKAGYNSESNELLLKNDLAESLASGNFNSNSADYRTLTHELTHAKDFGFGSLDGLGARASGDILSKPANVKLKDMMTVTQGTNGTLGDFIGRYRNQYTNPADFEARKVRELNAEYSARQKTAQKFGLKQENLIDVTKSKSGQQLNQASQLQSLAQGNPLLASYQSKINTILEISKALDKQLLELESQSSQSVSTIGDSDLVAFEQSFNSQFLDIAKVGQKLTSIQAEIESQLANTDGYVSAGQGIESQLDRAFGINDLKSVRKIKKQILQQIKSVKGDTNLDQSAKDILLSQFRDLKKKADVDGRLMAKTSDNPTAKDLITSPIDSIQTLAERKVIEVQESAMEMVHAVFDPVIDSAKRIAANPVKALGAAGALALKGANAGVRGILPAANAAYGVLKGVENVSLSIMPYGHQAKSLAQATLPAIGFAAATHSVPALAPVGHMIDSVAGFGAGQLQGMAGGAIGEIGTSVASNVPLIGAQLSGLVTETLSVATGTVTTFLAEVTATLLASRATVQVAKATVNQFGQLAESSTKQQFQALPASQKDITKSTEKAVRESAKKVKSFVEMAQNLPETLKSLPASQREIAQKFLPIVAGSQLGYSGELEGQKLAPVDIDLKKITSEKAAKKLDKKALDTVKDHLTGQYKVAKRALIEITTAMDAMAKEDRTGLPADLKLQLTNRVNNLAKKAKYLGLRVSDIKVEPPANVDLQSIDIESRPVVDIQPYKKAGEELVQGVEVGMESKIPDLVEVNQDAFEQGEEAFKTIAQIRSPSKKMEYLGRMIGAGLIAGVNASKADFDAAINKVVDLQQYVNVIKKPPTRKTFEAISDPWELPELAQNPPQWGTTGNDYSAWNQDDDLQKGMSVVKKAYTKEQQSYNEFDSKIQKLKQEISNNEGIELPATVISGSTTAQARLELLESQMDLEEEMRRQTEENERALKLINGSELSFTGDEETDNVIANAQSHIRRVDRTIDTIDSGGGGNLPPVDDIKNMIAEFARGNPVISGFVDKFQGAIGVVKKFGLAAAGGLGLFLIAKGLADVATSSVQVYRRFEGIFIASKMMSGSEVFIGKLRSQVKALGGDLESTMREGIQFVNGLQGTALEGQAQDLFLDSDKALKSLGLQTQQYDSAILALKQVTSKGKVSMEEISGQLGEAVPGALNIAAKAMGTNVQGLIQQIESGNVLSEEFVPKFVAQLEAQTAFLEPAIKKSLNTQIGKFQANVTDVQVGIGAEIAPNLAPIVGAAADGVGLLAQNIDKAILAVNVLAVALAMPVANAGLLSLQASIRANTIGLGAMSGVAKTAQVAIVGLAKAFAPLLVAYAAVELVSLGFAIANNYSQELTDSYEELESVLGGLSKKIEEATDKKREFERPITGKWALDAIDSYNLLIAKIKENPAGDLLTKALRIVRPIEGNLLLGGEGNTYGAMYEQENKDRFQKGMQATVDYLGQTRKVFSEAEVSQYSAEAKRLDEEIKSKQGLASALNMKDPVKNADQIATLRKEAQELSKLKGELDSDFLPGGEIGLEQVISQLQRTRQGLVDESLKTGGDYSSQIAEIDNAIGAVNRRLTLTKTINEDISNTVNRQRKAYIELTAAIAQGQQNLELSYSQQKTAILERQAAAQIGDKIAPQVTARLELAFNQTKFDQMQEVVAKRRNYLRTQLDANALATVEGIADKPIDQIDLEGVVKIQEYLKSAGNNVKSVITDQVVGELEKLANADLEMSQAKEAIAGARLSLTQANRDLSDYFLTLQRQTEDFYLSLAEQQISIKQQTTGFERQIEDAGIQVIRENRQMVEDYDDLMTDLAGQLRQAQNQIKDTKAQINQINFDREILEINPGGQNNFGRRLAGIFQQLFKSLDGNASEGRNIESQLVEVQKTYLATMRRIRAAQEQQADIERNRARTMQDLFIAERQLLISMQRAVMQLSRQVLDNNRQVTRDLGKEQAKPYLVQGSLNVPAIARPSAPNINQAPLTTRPANAIVPISRPALPPPPPATKPINVSVKSNNTNTGISAKDKEDLLKLIWLEAGGEDLVGMVAVARTVGNRQRLLAQGKAPLGMAGWGAKSATIGGVIHARTPGGGYQYQPVGEAKWNRPLTASQRALSEKAYQISLDPAAMQKIGVPQSILDDTNFQTTNLRIPGWWQGGKTRLGNHNFGNDKYSVPRKRADAGMGTLVASSDLMGLIPPREEMPELNFGTIPSEVYSEQAGNIFSGFFNQVNKELNEVKGKFQRFIKDPAGTVNRKFDLLKNIGSPNTWEFSSHREAMAHWYLFELGKTMGKDISEINKVVTMDMVKLLVSGQKRGKVKLFGQNIPQQIFEEVVKTDKYISPNAKLTKPQSAKTTQSTTKPKTTPKPKSSTAKPKSLPQSVSRPATPTAPKPTTNTAQSYEPSIVPDLQWAPPPMLDFSMPSGLGESILQEQTALNGLQQERLDNQSMLDQVIAVDSLIQSINEVKLRYQQGNRELESSQLAITNLKAEAKGYLTIQEEITKAGAETNEQFVSQAFSYRMKAQEGEREFAMITKYVDKIREELALRTDLDEKKRDELQSALATGEEEAKNLATMIAQNDALAVQVDANRALAVATKEQLKAEEIRLNMLKEQSDITAEFAAVSYRMGQGGVIDQSGIISAQMAGYNRLLEAKKKVDQGFMSSETFNLLKDTEDLKIAESINNAIPGLNEFGNGLAEVIKGTKSWDDALKDVLTSIADVVLQMLVIAPIKNMLGQAIGGAMGLGQITGTGGGGGGFDIGGLFSGLFGGIGKLLGFPAGGMIPYYADGGMVGEAINAERAASGKNPRMVVAHDGEQILTTLNGDAALWRALKRSGQWDELKSQPIKNYYNGGSVGDYSSGGSGSRRPLQTGNTLIINQNYKISTPDAGSFRKSQGQLAVEESNRVRRLSQRNG